MVTEEEIKQKLLEYAKPVRYSEFRKEFDLNDSNFVDRLCFLMSTGDVIVAGYGKEGTEFPKEVETIMKVGMGSGLSKAMGTYLDPYIIHIENARKL